MLSTHLFGLFVGAYLQKTTKKLPLQIKMIKFAVSYQLLFNLMIPSKFIPAINVALNSELRITDIDPRYVALNSYDYRCLKHEVEDLKKNLRFSFEHECSTLAGIMEQTDNTIDSDYPIRFMKDGPMGKHVAYQYMRLIDEILYRTDRELTIKEIAYSFKSLVHERNIQIKLPTSVESFAEAIGKRLSDLQSMVDCEFNSGNTRRYSRGSLQVRKGYWRSPVMHGGKDGERVSAFKMTIRFVEIVEIIREVSQMMRKFNINPESFNNAFPLLALLCDGPWKSSSFCNENLTPVKYTPNLKLVKYVSPYSSTRQIRADIEEAIRQKQPLIISLFRYRNLDILPYELRFVGTGYYLYGWYVHDKANVRIPFDWIVSVDKSDSNVNYFDFAELKPKCDEEVTVTLKLESLPRDFAIERLKDYGIDCLQANTVYKYHSHKQCATYLTVKTHADFVFFDLLAKWKNHEKLIDIKPVGIKKQFEKHWRNMQKIGIVRNCGNYEGHRDKRRKEQFEKSAIFGTAKISIDSFERTLHDDVD